MAIRLFARGGALAAAAALLVAGAAIPAAAASDQAFVRTATYPVYLNVPDGVDPDDPTVAEISTVTPDGNTLIYTDALGKRVGFLDISDPSNPTGLGTVALDQLGDADDQPTSVAAFGDYVLVVIDETGGDFPNPKGRVDVLRVSDRSVVSSIDLEGQPDSIAISKDGQYAAIAIENQRDEEFTPDGGEEGDLPQAPSGFVQVLSLDGDPSNWTAEPVELPADALAGLDTPEDAEPEYVTINSQNELAVTLQENNGVVIIDLATREIENVFSAGSVSLDGIDATKDGLIEQDDSISDVPREPDSIAWIGDDYLATANEGDWKGGSRGWTVFDTEGNVVWDAGSTYEQLAVRDGLHNEDRAEKKGTEPEGLAVAEIDGVTYAFVASERSNFVAVYNVDDPSDPQYLQTLFTTNGPEGILPIPGRNLLAVSSEEDDAEVRVRASVALYQLGADGSQEPTIVSADDANGQPIGWSALGALTADPTDANTLYSATDAALADSRIYTVDVSAEPAVITDVRHVTKDGDVVTLDIEGLFKRPQGGFWLASEGATGPENLLVRTDDAGVVQEEIALPSDVADHLDKWGLEGVTATTDEDGNEVVYVALQRPLDGEDRARIGRYDVASGEWSWLTYPLETTDVDGDWLGLSEITAVDADTLAVIERDKLNGPDAAVKRIYTMEVPSSPTEDSVTPVDKTLALDVLPALEAFNGWTQEKLEGFTIAADGQLYGVTDNDGLEDATGETQFLRLGTADEVFGTAPTPTETATPTASATPTETSTPTASATPTTTPAPLAPTGGSIPAWPLLAGTGLLLLAGAALLITSRRA
ncbi:MAG: esterase-like activity of phytase family protein [Microbacterium sp.]